MKGGICVERVVINVVYGRAGMAIIENEKCEISGNIINGA